MAVRKTVIEEDNVDPGAPRVVKTTRTTVNPDIHTQVVEEQHTSVDGSPTVRQTTTVQEPLVKTEHPQKTYEKKKSILRTTELIWAILGIIELLLGFRIALKALGADPASGFATFIYAISAPLAEPFRGVLQSNAGTGGSFFEWSTIIAAVVYAVVAYVLIMIIGLVRPVTPEEVDNSI